jgi:23S rRNA-/tRNA-specific pseudouridylate synthase
MGSPLIVSLTVSWRSDFTGLIFLTFYDVTTGVNRLDRLTSGLMILATTGKASTGLAQEFIKGHVKKEYLARVRGKFPE